MASAPLKIMWALTMWVGRVSTSMAISIKIADDLPLQASPNVPAAGIPQFAPVVLDTAAGAGPEDCVLATANTLPIIGVNQSVGGAQITPGSTSSVSVTAGESMAVRMLGVTKALAGGAITAGQAVAVNAQGQFVAVASLNPATTATNTFVAGFALDSASAAGDLFSLLLVPGLASLVTA